MFTLTIQVDPAPRFRLARLLLRLCTVLLVGGTVGCGDSGTVTVSKTSRARIVSDADAEGNITLPKTKKRGKTAAGLNTARSIMDKKKLEKGD